MATTPRYLIPYLAEGDRQKEVQIGVAYDIIDASLGGDMGEFTIANLPSAVANPGAWALVTDSIAGRVPVRSNGTDWKFLWDGTNIIREGVTVS